MCRRPPRLSRHHQRRINSLSFSNPSQLQYLYEVNATYGTVGPHSVAAVTTTGDLAFLFVLSATDKQWAKAGDKLRRVVRTFRA